MRSLIRDFQTRDGLLLLPEGIERLEGGIYAGEGDILRVVVPESVTFIGEEVFCSCMKLEEVILPPHVRELHASVFASCESLRRVVLPRELERIGEGAFLYCPALEHIELPPSLREICEMAFWGTGLREITLPPGVESVGDSAFWDCPQLRRAEVPGPDTRLERHVFGNCPALREGYIAPGFPQRDDPDSEMIYSLLWCSCPDRHSAAVGARAERFLRAHEEQVMDWVLEQNAIPVMTGLSARRLLTSSRLGGYVSAAAERGETEITALLLQAQGAGRETEEEFAL